MAICKVLKEIINAENKERINIGIEKLENYRENLKEFETVYKSSDGIRNIVQVELSIDEWKKIVMKLPYNIEGTIEEISICDNNVDCLQKYYICDIMKTNNKVYLLKFKRDNIDAVIDSDHHGIYSMAIMMIESLTNVTYDFYEPTLRPLKFTFPRGIRNKLLVLKRCK